MVVFDPYLVERLIGFANNGLVNFIEDTRLNMLEYKVFIAVLEA